MAGVAVIGEGDQVRGYALAGVRVLVAEGAEAVRAAWRSLDDDVAVVILTPAAARHLSAETAADRPLSVVMPR